MHTTCGNHFCVFSTCCGSRCWFDERPRRAHCMKKFSVPHHVELHLGHDDVGQDLSSSAGLSSSQLLELLFSTTASATSAALRAPRWSRGHAWPHGNRLVPQARRERCHNSTMRYVGGGVWDKVRDERLHELHRDETSTSNWCLRCDSREPLG